SVGGILTVPPGDQDPDLEKLEARAVVGERPPSMFSTFLTRIAIDDRDAILAHDISQHASLAAQKSLSDMRAESAICAPIRHAKAVLGVIQLYALQGAAPLTHRNLEFVLAVADQLGDQLFSIRQRMELETGLTRAQRHVQELQGQLEVGSELVGNSPQL